MLSFTKRKKRANNFPQRFSFKTNKQETEQKLPSLFAQHVMRNWMLHYKQQHSTETFCLSFRCAGETLSATFSRCDVIMQYTKKIFFTFCKMQFSFKEFVFSKHKNFELIFKQPLVNFIFTLKLKNISSRQFLTLLEIISVL